MNIVFDKWDIWIVRYPYDDINEYKFRPGIVIRTKDGPCEVPKCTSQVPWPGEYALYNWQDSGLDKPTTVRLSKRAVVPLESMKKKIGAVAEIDRVNIVGLLPFLQGK
jgi:hypothetical protein